MKGHERCLERRSEASIQNQATSGSTCTEARSPFLHHATTLTTPYMPYQAYRDCRKQLREIAELTRGTSRLQGPLIVPLPSTSVSRAQSLIAKTLSSLQSHKATM